jgi:hypothetical protein
MGMADLSDNLSLIIALVIVVPIGVSFVGGGVFAPGVDGGASVAPVVDQRVTVDKTVDAEPSGLDVSLTTSNAVTFRADAQARYVDSAYGDQWRNGSWGVMFVADLDEDVNQDAAYSAFAAGNGTVQLMRTNGDWLAYYDNGTESASVRVDARNQSSSGGLLGGIFSGETAAEPVVVRWDDGASTLYVETPDHAANATADTDTEPRPPAFDWVGTLDEARVISQYPTRADTDSYLSEPVAVLPDSEQHQAARYMLDEESGTTTEPYYTAESADVVGGELGATGVDGPGVANGTDYELSFSPLAIEALAGGELDGAPVVHLDWGGGVAGIVSGVAGVLPVLLFLIPLVMLANRVEDAL